jgi:hypothetical protein
VPLNAGTNWIKQRYLEPLEYLSVQDRTTTESPWSANRV